MEPFSAAPEQLFLVADDLSGALDSAVAFCDGRNAIPVFNGAPPEGWPPRLAVNSGTRDADIRTACKTFERLVSDLGKAEIAYQKIDSTLRGPWAEELACAMATGAFDLCIFAPAFPEQGRITRSGRQLVRIANGLLSAVSTDPLASLQRVGLRAMQVCSEVYEKNDAAKNDFADIDFNEFDVLVCDAETAMDMQRIAQWGRGLPGSVLWCGAAGLARALAGQTPARVPPLKPPLLAIVGSNHPVTCAQVDHAIAAAATRHVAIGQCTESAVAAIDEALLGGGSCLITFTLPDGVDLETAAIDIREKLAGVLPAVARPNALLVSGGETLQSVCLAVSVSHLDVDGELAPGVPHALLRGGLWQGVEVISKSGGFGSVAWLAEQFMEVDR